jgi:predicted alpha-1,2-mannosidase
MTDGSGGLRDTLNAAAGTSRRRFLQRGGVAAAAIALGGLAEAKAQPASLESRLSEAGSPELWKSRLADDQPDGSGALESPVDLVNLLQGTRSTPDFSTGNTLPIAALPFGMAHWTLQSQDGTPWFFQPDQRRVQGLRCTHQLSPWLGDYGQATFLPFRGKPLAGAAKRASSYRPEDAQLRPYSLELFLLRYRTKVELVPTERCCMMLAEFETDASGAADDPGWLDEPRGLIVDIPQTAADVQQVPEARQLRFTSTATSGGTPENFAAYYVVEFTQPWMSCETQKESGHTLAVVCFKGVAAMQVKIATSFISFEQAELNLQQEIGAASMAELREAAKTHWNAALRRIAIEGATPDQQRIFYSCMYRTLLFPRTWHEPNPAGGVHHFSAFNGRVEPGVMYADHGYWDVYRAWYPLMTILFPERLGEILQAWVNAYKEGGWLPQFPAPGYRACMTGSLIDAVFGDAAVKGISGFDLATAYEALKKHATVPGDPSKGYGRIGIEQYLKLHYVPADQISQSVAETTDAAYGDFCIAQVARVLGRDADAKSFAERSGYWRNVFDRQVRFPRGKNADGSWLTPFDSFTWGSPYVEGGAWQHRWDAPQDVPGMMAAMDGAEASAAALEKMLTLPPIFHVGVYGEEIHEMSEMAAVRFGQYAQSNQPVHHLLYLFAHAGRPDRTEFWVRRVMQELYTVDTFPGDEDTGSMSAWYVLSTLGFYPACPGKAVYTLGAPLFARATVQLGGGKTFVVEAEGGGPQASSVQHRALNGAALEGFELPHEAVVRGGTLRVVMGTPASRA